MVPIPIAGWDVRESAMVTILCYDVSAGFLIWVLFGAALFLLGVAAGALWILSSN